MPMFLRAKMGAANGRRRRGGKRAWTERAICHCFLELAFVLCFFLPFVHYISCHVMLCCFPLPIPVHFVVFASVCPIFSLISLLFSTFLWRVRSAYNRGWVDSGSMFNYQATYLARKKRWTPQHVGANHHVSTRRPAHNRKPWKSE